MHIFCGVLWGTKLFLSFVLSVVHHIDFSPVTKGTKVVVLLTLICCPPSPPQATGAVGGQAESEESVPAEFLRGEDQTCSESSAEPLEPQCWNQQVNIEKVTNMKSSKRYNITQLFHSSMKKTKINPLKLNIQEFRQVNFSESQIATIWKNLKLFLLLGEKQHVNFYDEQYLSFLAFHSRPLIFY